MNMTQIIASFHILVFILYLLIQPESFYSRKTFNNSVKKCSDNYQLSFYFVF